MDCHRVRESMFKNQITKDVVVSMKVATRTACERIARWAYRYVQRRERKKLTVLRAFLYFLAVLLVLALIGFVLWSAGIIPVNP